VVLWKWKTQPDWVIKPVTHDLVRRIRFWRIKSPEHDFEYLYRTISKKLFWNLFTCKGTDRMYVPLQVNIFGESVLLVVHYRYLKSCSGDFFSPESDPPHKTMRYWFYYSMWLGFYFEPTESSSQNPRNLLRCGLFACIRFRPILKKEVALSGL